MPPEDIKKQIEESVSKYFGTDTDPEQLPPTREVREKYYSLHSNTVIYELSNDGKLVGWVSGFPTTKELMDKFLLNEINERQLFEQTEKIAIPEAVCLNVALVFPEYRKQGIAFRLSKKFINNFLDENNECEFFAWEFSNEGKNLMDSLEKDLGITIKRKITR